MQGPTSSIHYRDYQKISILKNYLLVKEPKIWFSDIREIDAVILGADAS